MVTSFIENFISTKNLMIAILIFIGSISIITAIHTTIVSNGAEDFQWDSAKILLDGMDPYQMNLNHVIPETQKFKQFVGSPYFPSSLVLLWPYALIPWPLAEYMWIISNILFTFLFLYNIFHLFLPNKRFLIYLSITCLLLTGLPWRYLIYTGQNTIFGLCFFSFALRYRNSHPEPFRTLSGNIFFKIRPYFSALLFFHQQKTIPPLIYRHYYSFILALIHFTMDKRKSIHPNRGNFEGRFDLFKDRVFRCFRCFYEKQCKYSYPYTFSYIRIFVFDYGNNLFV